jgi:hypothetical protein
MPLHADGERGECTECGRQVLLRADGLIGPHGDRKSWPPRSCPGWRQPPRKVIQWQ